MADMQTVSFVVEKFKVNENNVEYKATAKETPFHHVWIRKEHLGPRPPTKIVITLKPSNP